MCWQIFDTVVFNDLELELADQLLETWLDVIAPLRENIITSTSCYRGYRARWAIRNDELVLMKVESMGLKDADKLTNDLIGKRAHWVTAKIQLGIGTHFYYLLPEPNAGVELEIKDGRIVDKRLVVIPSCANHFIRALSQGHDATHQMSDSLLRVWNDPPKIFRDWLQDKDINTNGVEGCGFRWQEIDKHLLGHTWLYQLDSYLDCTPINGEFRNLELQDLKEIFGPNSYRLRHGLIYQVGDCIKLEDSTMAVVRRVRESDIEVLTDKEEIKTLPHAVPLYNPYRQAKVGDRFIMNFDKETWICTEHLAHGDMRIQTFNGHERRLSKLLKCYGEICYRSPQETRDYLSMSVDRLNQILKSPAFRGCFINRIEYEPEADGELPTCIGWVSIVCKRGHSNRRPVVTGDEITVLTFLLCAILNVFNINSRKKLSDFLHFYSPTLNHLLKGHLT